MWHIFENWDGSFSAYYEGPFDGLWSLLFLFIFFVLMVFLGSVIYPYLTIPLMTIALGIGLLGLCGDEDGLVSLATITPLLVYGWASICWLTIASNDLAQTGLVALMGWVIMAIVGILLIVVPMVEEYNVEAAIAFVVMAVLWFASLNGGLDVSTSSGMGKAFLYSFRVLLITTAGYVAFGAFTKAKRLATFEGARTEALSALAFFAAGFAPLLVAKMLSGLGPLVVLLATLACYAALAVAAGMFKASEVQWALVPLLVFGSFALMAKAPTQLLPPYQPALTLLEEAGSNLIMALGGSGAVPLVESLSWVLSKAANLVLGLVLRIFDTSIPSFSLSLPISLYLGIGAIIAVMGTTSTIQQKVVSKK